MIIADIELADLAKRNTFLRLSELTQGARWEIKCWNSRLSRTVCKGYAGLAAGNTFSKQTPLVLVGVFPVYRETSPENWSKTVT